MCNRYSNPIAHKTIKEMGMLKKYRNVSYAIIIGLVTVLISPVIGCAQNEGNALTYGDGASADPVDGGVSATEDYVEETSVNEVQTEKVKLQPQISSPGNFSNQNVQLNATIKSLQDVVKQKDAQINTVTTQLSQSKTVIGQLQTGWATKDKEIKTLQAAQAELTKGKESLKAEKDKKINGLNIEIQSLQAAVKKKDTELVALDKEAGKMNTDLDLLDKEVVAADKNVAAMETAFNCYRKALSNWDDLHRRKGLTPQNLLTIAVDLRLSIAGCPGVVETKPKKLKATFGVIDARIEKLEEQIDQIIKIAPAPPKKPKATAKVSADKKPQDKGQSIKNKVAGNNASPNNINQTNNNTPAAGTNNGGVPVQEDYY